MFKEILHKIKMDDRNTCQYCGNFFNTKATLIQHQKTAKYCLKKQGKINKQFQCEVCKKYYSSKQMLGQHTCPTKEQLKITQEQYEEKLRTTEEQTEEKIQLIKKQYEENKKHYEKIIEEYKQHIRELEDKLANIALKSATKPTSITNNKTINRNKTNIINNLLPITDEYLEQQTENFTLDHIRKKGASGYVQYAIEYPFRDRVACVDFARRKVIWKDQKDKIIEDLDMSELTQKFFQSIEEKNRELITDYFIQLSQCVGNEAYRLEKTIYDTKIKEVREIAEGEDPPLKSKFIKGVCQKTIQNN